MNNMNKAIENSYTKEEPSSIVLNDKDINITKLDVQTEKQKQKEKEKEGFYDNFLVSNSNNIIFYGIIIIIVIAVIYLSILSFINRDFDYPINHPFLFTLETLLMSVGIGSIVFFMAWGRNAINYDTFIQFVVVVLKFGILHILFQFSGIYSYILGTSNKSISKYIMHSNPAFY